MRLFILSAIFPSLISCGGKDLCGEYKNQIWHLEQDVEHWQAIAEDYKSTYDNKACFCEPEYQANY